MAHNRSPAKLRSDVLDSPLASFRGWRFELECPRGECPAGRVHPVDRLLRHYPGARVGDVTRRLKCVVCGRAPESVVLSEDRPGRRIALAGREVRY